jgi:hypothetical protein
MAQDERSSHVQAQLLQATWQQLREAGVHAGAVAVHHQVKGTQLGAQLLQDRHHWQGPRLWVVITGMTDPRAVQLLLLKADTGLEVLQLRELHQ